MRIVVFVVLAMMSSHLYASSKKHKDHRKKFGYEVNKTLLLDQFQMGDNLQEIKEAARTADEDRQSQGKKYSCRIIYENTPIRILNEKSISWVEVEVKKGVCKGAKGVIKATDIRIR
ncbi:MAG: hypothetical protein AB8G05_24985 [Oligoflexales bacterium]